ncbi:MAG TPA: hypothetical protein VHL98_10935 [Microvirga sp.]|jgi:hypothetical protein|nr:hypothetical protein [Microvirga sp.]
MMRLVIILAGATLFLAGPVAADGPFGVTMGSNPLDYPTCKAAEGVTGAYDCSGLPRSHPDMRVYNLISSSETGVCLLRGSTDILETSSFGSELRMKTEELKDQVSSVYGPSNKFDFIMPRSIWIDPSYWMMAIVKNDRHYAYAWNKDSKARLKDNIKNIVLSAKAIDATRGYVQIEYVFENHAKCQEEHKKARAKAF